MEMRVWLVCIAVAALTFGSVHAQTQTTNLYSESTAGKLSAAVAGALSRVYVPHVKSGDVYVIDPATFQVVDKFMVGGNPQHVIPSWDMKTLWVAGSAERNLSGIVMPIDPKTAKPGATIKVQDA